MLYYVVVKIPDELAKEAKEHGIDVRIELEHLINDEAPDYIDELIDDAIEANDLPDEPQLTQGSIEDSIESDNQAILNAYNTSINKPPKEKEIEHTTIKGVGGFGIPEITFKKVKTNLTTIQEDINKVIIDLEEHRDN